MIDHLILYDERRRVRVSSPRVIIYYYLSTFYSHFLLRECLLVYYLLIFMIELTSLRARYAYGNNIK